MPSVFCAPKASSIGNVGDVGDDDGNPSKKMHPFGFSRAHIHQDGVLRAKQAVGFPLELDKKPACLSPVTRAGRVCRPCRPSGEQ